MTRRTDPLGLYRYGFLGAVLGFCTSKLRFIENRVSRCPIGLSAGQNSGLSGSHNSPQDAYRHCLWSCQMTKDIGGGQATTIADNHEDADRSHNQSAAERQMDQANNAAGRSCGKNKKDKRSCEDKCKGLLDNGGLFGLGGVPMPPPSHP